MQFPGDGKNRALAIAKTKEMKGKKCYLNLKGDGHVERPPKDDLGMLPRDMANLRHSLR